jgi:hypothetical protein
MQGQCLCGAVRFSCSEAPAIQLLCHCRDCQRASGSGYTPLAIFAEAALAISGEVKYYASAGRSGKRIARGFCPNCGASLFGRLEKLPGMLAVCAGAFDEPNQFQPKFQIYTASAPAWDHLDQALRAFEGDAPPRKGPAQQPHGG